MDLIKNDDMRLVKVPNASCKHSGCRCKSYIGFQTPTGRYHGPCQNGDGWGHKCGHSPKEHGLKEG